MKYRFSLPQRLSCIMLFFLFLTPNVGLAISLPATLLSEHPDFGLMFDGVDDYIVVGESPALNFQDQFTLSLRFSIDAYPVNASKRQSEMLWARGSRLMLGFEQDKVDNLIWLRCYVRYADGKTQEVEYNVSRVNLADNAWHEIIVSFQRGERFTLSIDGMLVDSEPTISDAPLDLSSVNNDFIIGARRKNDGTMDRYFKGKMNHIKVFVR